MHKNSAFSYIFSFHKSDHAEMIKENAAGRLQEKVLQEHNKLKKKGFITEEESTSSDDTILRLSSTLDSISMDETSANESNGGYRRQLRSSTRTYIKPKNNDPTEIVVFMEEID